MRVNSHVGADKGEAARDDGLQMGRCGDRAEQFGRAFAFRVCRGPVKRIRAATERLGNVREMFGLLSIDGAGTDEKKSLDGASFGELQYMPSAVDDRLEHHQRCVCIQLRARLRRRVNHMRELAFGKTAFADICRKEGNRGIRGKVRSLPPKHLRMPGERDCVRVQIQTAICPGETLQ